MLASSAFSFLIYSLQNMIFLCQQLQCITCRYYLTPDSSSEAFKNNTVICSVSTADGHESYIQKGTPYLRKQSDFGANELLCSFRLLMNHL